MKQSRKLLSMFILIITTCILVGCSGKHTKITKDDFSSIAKDSGFETIEDVTDQFEGQSDFVESATIAENVKNNYQIEFYKLKNESNAKSTFEGNKEIFERQKVSKSKEASVSIGNYEKYSLTTSEEFMYVSRIDDTVLYVNAPIEYKDTISECINNLGY